MSAHPVSPLPLPQIVDDFLLDDEFDIFETVPPYSRKPGIGHDTVFCGDIVLDEYDNDNESEF